MLYADLAAEAAAELILGLGDVVDHQLLRFILLWRLLAELFYGLCNELLGLSDGKPAVDDGLGCLELLALVAQGKESPCVTGGELALLDQRQNRFAQAQQAHCVCDGRP